MALDLRTHIWHGRKWILLSWQNGSTLTSDLLVRMALNISTHIWHERNWILSPWQNGSALTFDLLVIIPLGIITFPWRKPRFGEQQASPWSTQTSLWLMASSTHQLSVPPLQHIGASLLPSTPYPWYSDTWSRYALTCHGTLDSLTTSHNFGYHNVYK